MHTEAQAALSSEERRQLIYASLLRYAPETASLRDRILERMVIAALVGSSATSPFRIGRIQRAMVLAPDAPLIRSRSDSDSSEPPDGVRKSAADRASPAACVLSDRGCRCGDHSNGWIWTGSIPPCDGPNAREH